MERIFIQGMNWPTSSIPYRVANDETSAQMSWRELDRWKQILACMEVDGGYELGIRKLGDG